MMLSHCNNFKIFGDGGKRLVLIATIADGSQNGFIVSNPFIDSLTVQRDMIDCCSLGGERHFMTGYQRTSLSMQAGEVEFISGPDLERIYDPVMQRSICELLAAISTKLDER